jgi:hypothetical protein
MQVSVSSSSQIKGTADRVTSVITKNMARISVQFNSNLDFDLAYVYNSFYKTQPCCRFILQTLSRTSEHS